MIDAQEATQAHTAHQEKVTAISERIKALLARGESVRLDKGGVSHFVPIPGDPRLRYKPVDISGLDRILTIDAALGVCMMEPAVTFAELLRESVPRGWIPAVVPELEGITVGGAVTGCSLESMSYRYGGFHDSAMAYEVIGGDGEVVSCSPAREPLTFEMMHGSYGTLGVLSLVQFQMVRAKPYVRLDYETFSDFDVFQAAMMDHVRAGDYDFIDGLAHGPARLVLCLGRFVAEAPYTSSYRWLNIYYKSTLARRQDYLTTADYCFRYDTECHWLTRGVPLLESWPARLLAGPMLLGSTNLIAWSRRLESVLKMKKRPDVVCDYFIPARRLGEYFAWHAAELAYYPLWIVPYRPHKAYPWINPEHLARIADPLLVDCAVYGLANDRPGVDLSQVLEDKTFELDGIKTLISRNHYSEERFWQIYNRDNYETAKRRLDPSGTFPGLYEKIGRRA